MKQTVHKLEDEVFWFTDMSKFGRYGEPEFVQTGTVIKITTSQDKNSYAETYHILKGNCTYRRPLHKTLRITKKTKELMKEAQERWEEFTTDHIRYQDLKRNKLRPSTKFSRAIEAQLLSD